MDKLGPYTLNTAILGDCLEVMRAIPDNSIDSIVCDPPYGLSKEPDMVEVLTHWLNGDDYEHRGGGFMGKSWDSFVPGPAVWRECFRALKPGGCLMAFGGTRTCDLLSIAIRLAGFQRFDQIVWIHGQGFSKGLAVDKGIDSLLGKAGEREIIGEAKGVASPSYEAKDRGNIKPAGEYKYIYDITAPATEAAALWSGWRSQLKPAHEVILCFWKPREKSFAHNALKYSVAGLWIDGCRIATDDDLNGGTYSGLSRDQDGASAWQNTDRKNGKGSGFKRGIGEFKQPSGRFPSNCLISHDPRCMRVGVKQVRGDKPTPRNRVTPSMTFDDNEPGLDPNAHIAPNGYADPDGLESVPDYRCHPDCAVLQLDRQAGVRKSGGRNGKPGNGWVLAEASQKDIGYTIEASTGSASRFFYCPKAPPREKWFYCEICDDCYPYAQRDDHAHGKPKGQRKHQIAHPTVKPISIVNFTLGVLEYLCRLTKTPTGGIVLDPFGGSGTTALAAIANGRPFLLIENDPIYYRIATKRIEQAMKEPHQLKLI